MITPHLKKYNFLKLLESLKFVEKIILYGSRARGDNVEKSDIDLAIYCPQASSENWLQILNMIADSDSLLKIDCVRLDNLDTASPLKCAIEREGKVIYSRK